jgi:hypothetical protein
MSVFAPIHLVFAGYCTSSCCKRECSYSVPPFLGLALARVLRSSTVKLCLAATVGAAPMIVATLTTELNTGRGMGLHKCHSHSRAPLLAQREREKNPWVGGMVRKHGTVSHQISALSVCHSRTQCADGVLCAHSIYTIASYMCQVHSCTCDAFKHTKGFFVRPTWTPLISVLTVTQRAIGSKQRCTSNS